MRNCGMELPPPEVGGGMQSGRGSFTRAAIRAAEVELQKNLSGEGRTEKSLAMSEEYPGFREEAVRDLNRADYVVDGKRLERGDVAGIVESIRNFCVDRGGNRDETLLGVVAKLVYQESSSLGIRRFASGGNSDAADKMAKVQSAPIMGQIGGAFRSTYQVSRIDENTVRVGVRAAGPATNVTRNGLFDSTMLDPDQSWLEYNVAVDVDARDYSARVIGLNYDFQVVPTGPAES